MKKSSHVQIINRSHGVAILFSLTMGSCHAGDYEIKENCAPIDTCGDGIDNDCKNGIDDGCDCMIPGESRQRIPPVSGKHPLDLFFGPSSVCKLDTEVCQITNMDGKYKWISQKTGSGPSAINDKTCDNKDDDCNGIVDDGVADKGMTCTPVPTTPPTPPFGYCLAGGVYGCSAKGATECIPLSRPVMNPSNRYYSNPYIDSNNNPGWDWSCNGSVSLLTCQLSALNSFPYFDRPATLPQSCALNIALPGTIPSIQPYTSSICSACTTSNMSYWQYTSALPFPSTIQSSECGRIFTIAQCSGTSSSTCRVTNVDALTILCQ